MKRGKIKFYSRDWNFGFVVPSMASEPEVYLSAKACDPTDLPHLRGGTQAASVHSAHPSRARNLS